LKKDNDISPDMPAWLGNEEQYQPLNDRDTFVNKSILSFMKLLARIRTQDDIKRNQYHVNPTLKVIFTFLFILLLSLSGSFTFVVVMNIYLLVVLSTMEGRDIISILIVALIMTAFTIVILLPTAFLGNSYSIVMIPTKVFASITAVNILSHATRWSDITGALKRLHVPDLFIFVLDITIKYVVLLGEFALNMLQALRLRSIGKNNSKYASLSGIAGTLFIKSKEMAEEMYHAMECRGFTGEYQGYRKYKMGIPDYIFVAINAGIVFAFVYLERGLG
jgi:cobalt/nickel transport system permease protein